MNIILYILICIFIFGVPTILFFVFINKNDSSKDASYSDNLTKQFLKEGNKDNEYYQRLKEEYEKKDEYDRRDLSQKSLSDIDETLTPPDEKDECDSIVLSTYIKAIEEYLAPEPQEEIENYTEEKSDRRYSIKVDIDGDASAFPFVAPPLEPTFQERLIFFLEKKGLTNVDFYKAAWIDKKLFSAINCNKYYKPKKTTAVACCLGLQLSLTETNILLKAAGYVLSDSIKWDAIIKYCIKNKIYNIWQVNQILDEMGEKCIGC